MLPTFQRAFSHLHTRTMEAFGDDTTQRMWWLPVRREDGETADRTEYTNAVSCACAPVRESQTALNGGVSLGTDAITLHATRADFPYPPKTGDVFFLGPADAEGRPAESCDAWYLLTVATAAVHSHVRMTAQLHGG